MRKLVVGLCVLISLHAFGAKNRKDVPPAPRPAVVVNAKRDFLDERWRQQPRVRHFLFRNETVGQV